MPRVTREWRMAAKETYNLFLLQNPNIQITYLEYQKIIYGFNYGFRDFLLETGEKGKLPWGIGDFMVSKRKPPRTAINPKTGEDIINLPINWKETRERGYKVYHLNRHTDGFKFSFKWSKRTARFKHPELWVFKPCRDASRLIKHYLTRSKDQQNTYQEWGVL